MAVKSTEEFWAVIEKSGILTAAQGDRARELGGDLPDLKQLARLLVKENVLTTWQARQLLAGVVGLRIGNYRLLDELGRSEYGRVYLAEHQQLSRRVALKLLSRELSGNQDALRRFLVDAQSIAALDHPRLVHTLDISNDGDRYFIVWEYVEGHDLQRIVQESGPLDVARAVTLAQHIADGLAHAHGHDVVHGDLKPANVLVDANKELKIVDLGVARLSRGTPADGPTTAPNATPVGDPYRAPEARTASTIPAPASDLYSLGGILYYLLSGQPPTLDSPASSSSRLDLESLDALDSSGEMTEALLAQLAAVRPEVPDDLLELCRRLLATAPESRFASAEEARTAFAGWLESQPPAESAPAAPLPAAAPAARTKPAAAATSKSSPVAGAANKPPVKPAASAPAKSAGKTPAKTAGQSATSDDAASAEGVPSKGASPAAADASAGDASTKPRPAPRPAAPPPKRPLAKARPLNSKPSPPPSDSATLADSATIANSATIGDSISFTDSTEILPGSASDDASAESTSADDASSGEESSAPLVFKPTTRRPGGARGKPTKRPPAKPDAGATPSDAEGGEAPPVARKVPWLLIGLGVGGAGLVLVSVLVLVLWIIFGGDEKPVVAKNPGENAAGETPVDGAGGASNAAANPENGAADGAAAGSPDAKPDDANPAAGTPGAEQPVPGSPVVPGAKPGESPAASPETKPGDPTGAKPESKPADMPVGEPAKPDSKPEPKPEPKPPAPKPEPKSAPKPMVDPFKDFPTGSVELPALMAESGPAPDAFNPVTLGKLHVDPKALVIVNLMGGDGAMKGKFRFVLEAAENGTAERDWEFFLREGEAETGGTKLAHLALKGDDLSFQWQQEAASQPAAPHLVNCLMRIATGPKNQLVALRKPIMAAPMKAEIMKANAKGRWDIPYLPDPDKVKVELTFDPTFPKQRIEGQPVLDADKGKMTVWFGNTPEEQTLAIKFESAVRKGIEISLEPQFRIGSVGKPERLSTASLKKAQQIAAVSQTQTFGAVQMMKGQAAKKNDELTKTRVAQLEEQLATIQRATQQLEAMKMVVEQINAQGQINARVYYQTDDGAVDLLRTGGGP